MDSVNVVYFADIATDSVTFSESYMSNLQSVSIIAILPIGIVIVMIAISFLKDMENSC